MRQKEIIEKYKLKSKEWTHKSFHGVLHFFFPVGEQAIKPLKKYYGDCHKITVFYFKDNLGDWYWNNEDMIRLRKSFIKKVNRNPQVLSRLMNDWRQRLKRFEKIMREINRTDMARLSDQTLLSLYQKWYQAYLNEYALAIGIQDSFSMHADDFLFPYFEKIIENIGYKNLNEIYNLLLSPVKESFIECELKDRLMLLKSLKIGTDINSLKFQKMLVGHSKKYHWLLNNYATDRYLDAAYFKKQLTEMAKLSPEIELRKINARLRKIILTKRQLMQRLALTKKAITLVRITEVFSQMQDERKKYVLIASHYQNIFIKEFGRRLGLTKKEMEYTFIHELGNLLKNKSRINRQVFIARREGVLVINTLKGYEVIDGALAEKIHSRIFKNNNQFAGEVKGTVASDGYAKGVIKVIKKTHDLVNMVKGDILVASMTRPEMAPAMKLAAAIVTDEGGVTCHAAIISRELKIPCVIGTKIATQVFKDGDLVEVDANRGIVRKLT